MKLPKVCILIPAYNCAHFLPNLVEQIIKYLPSDDDEIIILNDGSSDNTFDVAKTLPRVKAYTNGENKGYGFTCQQLNKLALERQADLGLCLHGDFGHDPSNIPKLLKALEEGGADAVVGSRLLFLYELNRQGFGRLFNKKARNDMPLIRALGNMALTSWQNFCYGTKLHCFHEGMRVVTKKAMEWISTQELPVWYQYDGQLYVRLSKNNFTIAELSVPPFYTKDVKTSAPPFRYGVKCAWLALKYKLRLG